MAKEQSTPQKAAPEVKAGIPALPVLKADTSTAGASLLAGTPAPVEHNPNEYLLVSLDKEGNEDGQVFNIGVATFNRVFLPLTTGDNPTFAVKKSPIKR